MTHTSHSIKDSTRGTSIKAYKAAPPVVRSDRAAKGFLVDRGQPGLCYPPCVHGVSRCLADRDYLGGDLLSIARTVSPKA